jgi:flagellar motor switch protein FliG
MGNLLRHGVDMYKQTINMKNNPPPQNAPDSPPPKRSIPRPNLPMELVKTGENKDGENAPKESKYRRVAKFLILIGSEQAAEILAELDPQQVDEISKEIALTKIIKPEERDEIMAEFHALFSKPYSFSGSSQGGIETARRILYAAKGPEKGEELLNRAIPESKENLFSFLDDFSTEQLVMLLKNESAQTTAVILARLPPKLSAGTISKLPSSRKTEVLKRIAHQREVSPEVLEQVSAALKEKARHISGNSKDIEIDGMQTLAAILKQGDYSFGDRLINELEQEDPDIGKDLKEKLYTLDDVVNTVDRPIQDKLKTMSEHDIAVLLKGRGEAFSRKILFCVSSGRRKLILEESELIGAVPKRDCDAVAGEFLAWFRLARENGNIILYSDEDVFV